MSAAIAEVLGRDREYFLFDSFEGLPPARDIDGPAALAWQQDTSSPTYFNNCCADKGRAEKAMAMSGARNVRILQGWFSDTLRTYPRDKSIAILRLDGDWYDSTMECLTALFPLVAEGGLVIVDDYYAWDGCARAVHDFLSRSESPCKLHESNAGICYFVKPDV
jgi:O-methyltransferase